MWRIAGTYLLVPLLGLLGVWAVPADRVGWAIAGNVVVSLGVLMATTSASVGRVVVDGGARRFRWGTMLLVLGLANAIVRFVGVEVSLRGGALEEKDRHVADGVFFLSGAVGFSVMAIAGLVLLVSVWRPTGRIDEPE